MESADQHCRNEAEPHQGQVQLLVRPTHISERHQGVRGRHNQSHHLEADQGLEDANGHSNRFFQMLRKNRGNNPLANSQYCQQQQRSTADEAAAKRLSKSHVKGPADAEREVRIQTHPGHETQRSITGKSHDETANGGRHGCRSHDGLRRDATFWICTSKDDRVHHQNVAHGHPVDEASSHLRLQGGTRLRDLEEVINLL
mmetsp:Transcript_37824/g.87567  ORF Transcript_37824/g.87567 Transcript_37824/m.87567 type:complete len:200 (-) Transcript_37824:192-791(-)